MDLSIWEKQLPLLNSFDHGRCPNEFLFHVVLWERTHQVATILALITAIQMVCFTPWLNSLHFSLS